MDSEKYTRNIGTRNDGYSAIAGKLLITLALA